MSEQRKPLDLVAVRARNQAALDPRTLGSEAYLALCLSQSDVEPLCDEIEALRELVRGELPYCTGAGVNPARIYCWRCYAFWPRGEPEVHKPGCFVGEARALLGEGAGDAH